MNLIIIFLFFCFVGLNHANWRCWRFFSLVETGNKWSLTNYRSVSLLFSQMLWKLRKKARCFLKKSKLLIESQYDFQTRPCTALPSLKLLEDITTAVHCKKLKSTIRVIIDFFKNDTIDHIILMFKYHQRN